MLSILNMKLNTIQTEEAILIHKAEPSNEEMCISLSRKFEKSETDTNAYTGKCVAELRFASEEDLELLNCSFVVRVSMTGHFSCTSSPDERTSDKLNESILFHLLPHVRACMASLMSSAGVSPYLIPSSIIPELS